MFFSFNIKTWAVITGGNQGIGYSLANYLVYYGCNVIIGSRNIKSGTNAMNKIMIELIHDIKTKKQGKLNDFGKIKVISIDLTDMNSIHNFVNKINSMNIDVNILVNNAGIYCNNIKIKNDIELHWLTNFVGGYALTNLLLSNIIKSDKKYGYARIINVSAAEHCYGNIECLNGFINDETRGNIEFWKKMSSKDIYNTTKLAQVMHMLMLCKHIDILNKQINDRNDNNNTNNISKCNVKCMSVTPGWCNTNLVKFNTDKLYVWFGYYLMYLPMKYIGMLKPDQGIQSILYLLFHGNIEDDTFKNGCFHGNGKVYNIGFNNENVCQIVLDKTSLLCNTTDKLVCI